MDVVLEVEKENELAKEDKLGEDEMRNECGEEGG